MVRSIVITTVLLWGTAQTSWSQLERTAPAPSKVETSVQNVNTSACVERCAGLQNACLDYGNPPIVCWNLFRTCSSKCSAARTQTVLAADLRRVEPPTCALRCEDAQARCLASLPPGAKPTACTDAGAKCLGACSPPEAR